MPIYTRTASPSVSELLNTIVKDFIEVNAQGWYNFGTPQRPYQVVPRSGVVKRLLDQTTSYDDALLSTTNGTATGATLSGKANRQNRRQFLQFDGGDHQYVSDIDLNGNAVTLFVVYRRTQSGSASNLGVADGLIGHGNGGWDKRIVWGGGGSASLGVDELVIGSTTDNNNTRTSFGGFPANADAMAINQWNVLSIHWDGTAANASRVYVNGQLTHNFTHRVSPGAATAVFGGSGPNVGAGNDFNYNGDVGEVLLFKQILDDLDVRRIHEFFRRRWGLTGWDVIDIERN